MIILCKSCMKEITHDHRSLLTGLCPDCMVAEKTEDLERDLEDAEENWEFYQEVCETVYEQVKDAFHTATDGQHDWKVTVGLLQEHLRDITRTFFQAKIY